MSKFVCNNPDCLNFGKVETFSKDTYKWNPERKQYESENLVCPHCGSIRQEIMDDTPLEEKGLSFAKFQSASPEKRKEMLKKRSHEHYEKEVKPFKEHQLNEAVKQFKEASK